LIVKTLDPVGDTGLTVKDPQVIPEERLLLTHDSVTGCAVPAFNVTVIVTVPELPC